VSLAKPPTYGANPLRKIIRLDRRALALALGVEILACQPRVVPLSDGTPQPAAITEDTSLSNVGLRWLLTQQLSQVSRDSARLFLSPFSSRTSVVRHSDSWLESAKRSFDGVCDPRARAACPSYDDAIFVFVGIGRVAVDSAEIEVGAEGHFRNSRTGWWNGRTLNLARSGGAWHVVGYHAWSSAS
jgi:hypothetical protein